ncbi:hypothetical protein ES703_11231 [subsurface metagenome]
MPIYQYICNYCGNEFEEFKNINGADTVYCPICGEEAVRVFSSVSILFKGSGFYTTDSKKYGKKSSDFKFPKESSEKNDDKED